jgi:homoserine O-acetyltransferase
MNNLEYKSEFQLENGEFLSEINIAYHTYGQLDTKKSNVIWICHAFTANSDALDWWNGLVGEDKLFDTTKYFIVCANILGSCYGTTGPLTVNQNTGKPFYRTFPQITTRDMVNAHEILRKHLKIDKIHTVIGGSVGGHQSIEWAIMYPKVIENLILIATNARFSPWGIAISESQRLAIEADATFFEDRPDGGQKGLKAARSIALLSYRNSEAYNFTQKDEENDKIDGFRANTYQQYQGEKLVKRFNAYSYYVISKALDSHNVGRNRGSAEQALQQIKARTLIIGIDSDILFLPEEQHFMHKYIPKSKLEMISSKFGHDGFLIEYEKIQKIILNFYQSEQKNALIDKKIQYSVAI